jgi:NRPS condensation-like uncharacterized protein
MGHHCSVNFVMHARVSGDLSADVLRPALKAIQARHPLLRVRIERTGWNTLWFKASGVPEIPLRVVEKSSELWVSEAEDELRESFPVDEGPLVRCTLVQHGPETSTILLTFHHAIGDAMSGAYLIRDLVMAMGISSEGKAPILKPLEPKLEMNAYFPDRAKGVKGRLLYYRFIGRMLWAIMRWGRPTLPKLDQKAAPKERLPRIVHHRISPEAVERLHALARSEKTTLHGALLAAQVLAIAQDRESVKDQLYLIGSPVNLRRRLIPPVGEDVGFFVTIGASVNAANSSTEFWSLAREIKESLWECVERGEPFVYLMQHKDFSGITALLGLSRLGMGLYGRLIGKANMGGLAFSNIGKVDIETVQGPFNIESLGFAASGSGISPFVTFASTIEKESTWNFMGMEPLISKEHTERIAANAIEILHNSIS